MPVNQITNPADPALDLFRSLTENQLRNTTEPGHGIFIAESPKVITVALDAGCEPLALLCESKHIDGQAAPLIARCADIPVYTGNRELLAGLTGYTLTRGILCAMRRPALAVAQEICEKARRVAVLDGVVDSTNVGAVFRSAAALGMDAVLLSGAACDPLNRRVVRVSMGSVFLVPWARVDDPVSTLKQWGFCTAAMALSDRSISIDHPALKEAPRLALIFGAEGDGLSDRVLDAADYVVRIPMHHRVDSLNVAASAAVAFWEIAGWPD